MGFAESLNNILAELAFFAGARVLGKEHIPDFTGACECGRSCINLNNRGVKTFVRPMPKNVMNDKGKWVFSGRYENRDFCSLACMNRAAMRDG